MKLKFLELCLQQQKKEEILPPQHYTMKEVFNRLQQNQTEEKPVTIQDLRMEVNVLKLEVKHLQTSNIAINTEIKRINGKLQKEKGIADPTPEYNSYQHHYRQGQ